MKGFFVTLFATAFVSVTLADLKPIREIQQAQNASLDLPSRIIRGTPASAGQFPYQVHLTNYGVPAVISYCGGSIIHPSWVMTAAHCAGTSLLGLPVNNLLFRIRAGSLTVSGTAPQSRDVLVMDVHTPTPFNPNTVMNDIALLRIRNPFLINSNVAPIPLVAANTNPESYVGNFVTASGFGYATNAGPTSDRLLYTDNLKVISFAACQTRYRPTAIPTTSFCVEDTTIPITATCSGDSGGPVTMVISGQKRLIGVVSYGARAGCDTHPQGQTNVAQFVLWVRQVTGLPL